MRIWSYAPSYLGGDPIQQYYFIEQLVGFVLQMEKETLPVRYSSAPLKVTPYPSGSEWKNPNMYTCIHIPQGILGMFHLRSGIAWMTYLGGMLLWYHDTLQIIQMCIIELQSVLCYDLIIMLNFNADSFKKSYQMINIFLISYKKNRSGRFWPPILPLPWPLGKSIHRQHAVDIPYIPEHCVHYP